MLTPAFTKLIAAAAPQLACLHHRWNRGLQSNGQAIASQSTNVLEETDM